MRQGPEAPGGARRPGRRSRRDEGAVAVEAALALLGLAVVLVAVVWVVGVLLAQLALGEAARSAARVAARGESAAAVRAEAARLVPDAEVRLADDGDHVVVEVTRTVRAPGLLARWGSVGLRASSVAAAEAT
ncbi:MAG: TadE family type IV pilus minor pilin [Candidatus Nanopelagicales bacterium]|jgi:hypothetical protein